MHTRGACYERREHAFICSCGPPGNSLGEVLVPRGGPEHPLWEPLGFSWNSPPDPLVYPFCYSGSPSVEFQNLRGIVYSAFIISTQTMDQAFCGRSNVIDSLIAAFSSWCSFGCLLRNSFCSVSLVSHYGAVDLSAALAAHFDSCSQDSE